MATLFDVDRSRITRHIRNIYNDKELDEDVYKRQYLYCSSSNVRELLRYGQDISHMVPECVWQDLEKVKR